MAAVAHDCAFVMRTSSADSNDDYSEKFFRFKFFHAYPQTAMRRAAATRPRKVPMKHAVTS